MNQDADQPKDASPEEDAPVVHTATLSEPKAQPGKGAKQKEPRLSRKERNARAKAEYKTARSKYNSWWSYYHAEQIIKPYGSVGGWLWKGTIKPIGTVVIIVIVFRSMLLDWNDVPTGSMEPEIHVGDRIAVNRLAYGLQFPLTGPQIGIPFTPLQWDNPLDGIPQIEWGAGPQRGDIVTFWNPVTDVRMVKRIVAGPGDTIEMRGGKLTINGEAAGYTELDPVEAGLPLRTKWQIVNSLGRKDYDYADVEYQSESLLGLTRKVQHIKERWLDELTVFEYPDGTRRGIEGRLVPIKAQEFVRNPQQPDQLVPIEVDRKVPIDVFLRDNPAVKVVYQFKDGRPYLGDEAVSQNTFAAFLLKRYEAGVEADLLNKIGLGVKDHDLLVDGQPTFSEQFMTALQDRFDLLEKDEQEALRFSLFGDLELIRRLLSTNFGPYTVPDESYLMIGDNRNNSSDGRFFGPVKRSEITGKAFAVAFSFEDNKMLTLPPDPAWGRFFKDLD